MTGSFDFVSTEDKPALIAFSTPEWLEVAKTALQELGYKVHTAATHSDFLVRFGQVHYQVVIVEENLTLQALQTMPVNQRRHSTVFLLGDSFQTLSPSEGFKYSVHAVVSSSEMFLLKQLVEKTVAENNLFLNSFREVQARVYSSGTRL